MFQGMKSQQFPVLPLRDIVVFPHMIVPLFVGRDKSVRALEDVMQDDKQILLVAQKNAAQDDPTADDIYNVGTVSTVLQLLKLPDGTVKVLVEGVQRAKVTEFVDNPSFFEVEAELIPDEVGDENELEALSRSVIGQFEQYIKLNKKIPPEVLVSINQIDEANKLADTVASHLALKISEKQELLEIESAAERLERVYSHMESEIGVLQVEKKIRNRVKRQMEKTQREYYLNEQLKAIQKELGETDEGKDEVAELEEKIGKTRLTKEAKEKAEAELKKLRSMSPMSAEATVVRNYLDWMLSIPWKKRTRVKKDLLKAEEVLNDDHYGLEKVKERILEYLAVQHRTNKVTGPILCLVGPPGVGKTSLGKSIAKATGRNFVRMSLGGVRDESEIRGHRRTYIGSMPGKVIQGMKKAKSSNPLFLLDEVDKMGQDWRGDPASALLEVLDPEQNVDFLDHYLDVRMDLSKVLFVCTANTLDSIPGPLLDRMEQIRLSGYIAEEKLQIAKHHLWPKLLKRDNLPKRRINLSDAALKQVIDGYAREAGVRQLEKQLHRIVRKAAVKLLEEDVETVKVSVKNLEEFLGAPLFRKEKVLKGEGVVTGLAWTSMGGATLPIEAGKVHSLDRGFKLTGKLGDVMKESANIAYSYTLGHLAEYGADADFFDSAFVHLHVPEGATPKDGPSAGVTMTTALLSLAKHQAITRPLAMTGELTLTGQVLPVGGIREKVIAARRSDIFEVILPEANRRDYEELPDYLKEGMTVHFANRYRDVANVVFK